MSTNEYRFRRAWHADAPTSDVFDLLYTVARYPDWWPPVRHVERIGEKSFRVHIRSILPYDLRFELSQEVVDEQRGLLKAGMRGDLEGFSRWTLTAHAEGTSVRFDEHASLTPALLRALDPVARPAFQLNHSIMMRACERGMRAALSGIALGRATRPLPT